MRDAERTGGVYTWGPESGETLSDSFHLGFPRGKLMRNWMTSKAKGPADSVSPRSLFSSV